MNLAIILGYLGLVVGGAFVGAYAWYRLVTWPQRRRDAREHGFAIIHGENVSVPCDEVRSWRPASFVRWLTGRDMRA
jgi:hypothetical protein